MSITRTEAHVERIMFAARATKLGPYYRGLANLLANEDAEDLAWAIAAMVQLQSELPELDRHPMMREGLR